MKRFIEDELKQWKKRSFKNAFTGAGARQGGKSFTIEKFGTENFAQTVEVNFELKLLLECVFVARRLRNPILLLRFPSTLSVS
ncbi:MAG: hypothetical protein KBC64_04640 [Simkaniaceae bacterium]|nr:hypothetical protein [Simkaniaceae bacterium]